MKALCVTGLLPIDLSCIVALFRQSGLELASEAGLLLADWHSQATAAAQVDPDDTAPVSFVDSALKKLAQDLFRANQAKLPWGWADARSLWFLDFWSEAEPDLCFLLMTVGPWRMLDATAVEPSRAFSTWRAGHREMLRFYHRHGGRALLVDADDCAAHPAAFLRLCATHWELPLVAPDAPTSRRQGTLLARQLAHQLCRDDPQLAALAHELEATVIRLAPDSQADVAQERTSLASDAVVTEYRRMRVQLQKAESRCRQLFEAQEKGETRYRNLVKENELLLLQLGTMHEELRYYFLQHQETQRQLEEALERQQQILRRYPGYWSYKSISISTRGDHDDSSLCCRFSDLLIAGRNVAELMVEVFLEGGCAGFRFCRNSEKEPPLVRWPTQAKHQQTLTIIPVGDAQSMAERFKIFMELSSSDWTMVCSLARLLADVLHGPDAIQGLEEDGRRAFLAGLERMLSITDALPPLLRYDRMELKREKVDPAYEHLWLRFETMDLGNKHWHEFEFRFSCANIVPDQFGTFPKFEFPEGPGQVPFEAWFPESSDDFGSKLELRFALPDAMDLDVWRRLSKADRLFVTHLIARLPHFLLELQEAGTEIHRPWDDWIQATRETARILAPHLQATGTH